MSSAESAMYRIERKASPPVHAECRIKRKASQTVHAECRIERKTPVHAECRTQCGVSRHRPGPSIRSLARSRAEECRVRKGWSRSWRYRWTPEHEQTTTKYQRNKITT